MPTPQKEAVLKDTRERISDVRGIYLADFSGMTVQSLSLLRKRCREQGVQFRVIKNTLLKRAFNERGIQELDEHLVGPTGLVFSPVNEMAPAKILSDFAKEFEKPRVKAAVVDGRLYDTKAIVKLAALPSREVLLSQLLGTFIAPMSTFLGAINAMLATPANMADALAREKSKATEA
jgi:large subunit ribosomal protein L10